MVSAGTDEEQSDVLTWRHLFEALTKEIQTNGWSCIHDLLESRLVPLFYAPLLFCGTPGDSQRLPNDKEKFGRCLQAWAKRIAAAVMDGELIPRCPDSWLSIESGEALSPSALVGWRELDIWALQNFGLSAGSWERDPRDLESEPNPLKERSADCHTQYRIIRALALALAETHPSKLKKDGQLFIGYGKPSGECAGIVGHLIESKFTDLKTSALERHIKKALNQD